MEFLLREPRWAIRAAAAAIAVVLLFALGFVAEGYGRQIIYIKEDHAILAGLGLYTVSRWAVTLLCVAVVAALRHSNTERAAAERTAPPEPAGEAVTG